MTSNHISEGVGSTKSDTTQHVSSAILYHLPKGPTRTGHPVPGPGRTPRPGRTGREPSITVQTPVDYLLVTFGNSSRLHRTHPHLHTGSYPDWCYPHAATFSTGDAVGVLFSASKPLLAEGFEEDKGGTVRKIQRTGFGIEHGNAQPTLAIFFEQFPG